MKVLSAVTLASGLFFLPLWAAAEMWFLGGYLAENPQQKVFLQISDGHISEISSQRPDSLRLIDSEDWIFPGLIDMHNHPNFNVFSPWRGAKGQFNSRYEWRNQSESYRQGPKVYSRELKKDELLACQAIRWAEMKAIAGGVTSMQGLSGRIQTACAESFGLRNLEVVGDLVPEKKLQGSFEIVVPSFVGQVFDPQLQLRMSRQSFSYEQAYEQFIAQSGLQNWLLRITHRERTLPEGLQMLFGQCAEGSFASLDRASFSLEALEGLLQEELSKPSCVEQAKWADSKNISALQEPGSSKFQRWIEKQSLAMIEWLYGSSANLAEISSASYLGSSEDGRDLEDLQLSEAVIALPWAWRRYAVEFHAGKRQRTLADLIDRNGNLGFATHLAEGRRDDEFTQREFSLAKSFGFVREGLVLIHAISLNSKELAELHEKDIPIVWSPTSNLLLYGQTLDLQRVLSAGVNLSLGSDWSFSGTKNILDEMKIAQQVIAAQGLQKEISSQDIVKMATRNAAEALGLSHEFGKVAAGYRADLILVPRTGNSSAHDQLIATTPDELRLTVIEGEARYGQADLLTQVHSSSDLQLVEFSRCLPSPKAYYRPSRYPEWPSLSTARENFDVNQVASQLHRRVSEMGDGSLSLDPIYHCDDESYRDFLKNYVSQQWPQQVQERASVREASGLSDDWDPRSSRY